MLTRLLHGTPGHPAHPPLTDATIGMFVLATGLAVAGYAGLAEDATAKAAWFALLGGLVAAAPTAVTGFADWLRITWGTPLWRKATLHLGAMTTAVALYGGAAWAQIGGYRDGRIAGTALALALAGFAALTAGGWLGGSIVYVHGMRVERRSSASDAERGDDRAQDTA